MSPETTAILSALAGILLILATLGLLAYTTAPQRDEATTTLYGSSTLLALAVGLLAATLLF